MATATGTVLVVDDEEVVRAALSQALTRAGHSVLTASEGDEALQILHETPVDVIISDQHMPGMSGVDLLKIVRVRHPLTVRIMLTADTDPEVPVRSINESEVYRFIRKPWNNADLRTVISLALDIAQLQNEKRHLMELLRGQSARPEDPVNLESELLQLAEDELGEH